jgi:hypothetical protein
LSSARGKDKVSNTEAKSFRGDSSRRRDDGGSSSRRHTERGTDGSNSWSQALWGQGGLALEASPTEVGMGPTLGASSLKGNMMALALGASPERMTSPLTAKDAQWQPGGDHGTIKRSQVGSMPSSMQTSLGCLESTDPKCPQVGRSTPRAKCRLLRQCSRCYKWAWR